MRGSQLPLPAYGSVLLLARLQVRHWGCWDRLENYREGSAAPSLHPPIARPRPGAKSFRGFSRNQTAVLGLSYPGLTNAESGLSPLLQGARDGGGPSASFVQIATGEDV